MTIVGETGGRGTKAIQTKYPETSGLTVGTTKQEGRQIAIVPEEESLVSDKENVGLNI